MTTMSVTLRNIPDTNAAVGWAGSHTVVVDRPRGAAGGNGLGFNGGQLLALAIGGCLCNDLHYVAHRMGINLTALAVDVTVTFDGQPLLAKEATVTVEVETSDPDADLVALIEEAQATSTVSNSLARGLPVRIKRPG